VAKRTTRNFGKELWGILNGRPPVGGRPQSDPGELIPAIMDLALDRRRSLSWIADRLLDTKYKDQRKSKKKLEERIAETLDHVGYCSKDRRPHDLRSNRERGLDYFCGKLNEK
jgi:hypothetical protein